MITARCQKIQMVRFVKKCIHRYIKHVNSSVKMGVHSSEDNKIKETRDKGLIVREWRKSSLMIYGIVLFFQVWIIINILSPAID